MLFDAGKSTEQAKVKRYFESKIKAPYVHAQISTLGGVSRAAVVIRVSLDKRSSWANGIYENSRYFMIHLDNRDGELEQFAMSYRLSKKLRKSKAKSLADAVVRINKYIGEVRR